MLARGMMSCNAWARVVSTETAVASTLLPSARKECRRRPGAILACRDLMPKPLSSPLRETHQTSSFPVGLNSDTACSSLQRWGFQRRLWRRSADPRQNCRCRLDPVVLELHPLPSKAAARRPHTRPLAHASPARTPGFVFTAPSARIRAPGAALAV